MTTICQKAIKDKYITHFNSRGRKGPSIQYVHGELFRFHQHYNLKKVVSVLLDHGSHFSDPLLNFYFLKPVYDFHEQMADFNTNGNRFTLWVCYISVYKINYLG